MLKSLSLLTLLLVTAIAAAYSFPPLTGRVVDQADLLSASAEAELSAKLAAHEQKTTNQVVVATLNSLEGGSIEEYGVALGRHWGIGQKERDNGVLLLVVGSAVFPFRQIDMNFDASRTELFVQVRYDFSEEMIREKLEGNDLPRRWQHHAGHVFTIFETGFGTGLNFLATWQAC